MEKYLDGVKEKAPLNSSEGFHYDLFYGGYIRPENILVDKERVKKIQEAVKLLEEWYQELVDDGIYDDM